MSLATEHEYRIRPPSRVFATGSNFESVGFAYDPDDAVLNDISFHDRQGEVSPSSDPAEREKARWSTCCRASTMSLADDFLIDGRDVREFELESLRRSDRDRHSRCDSVQRYDPGQHRLR